jgi:HK97 family phage major capsid protein
MEQFTKEQIEQISKTTAETFDKVFSDKLPELVGNLVATNVKTIVQEMRAEQASVGKDKSGLSAKQKIAFAEAVRMTVKMDNISADTRTKANEALIEEQDNRGGYLVSHEVADAILRIAASVGTILSQAQKWTMETDELGIPNYTGSFLTGQYLNVDQAGPITGITFGQALLIVKKWQLAFVVGNDLLLDASVNLADWLLAMAGEALANMVDQQGFTGTGSPFVGILNEPNTTTYTLGSGRTSFSNTSTTTTPNGFDVLYDSSQMIGNLEESILDSASFYVHRTVWAAWRTQKDTSGNFVLPFGGIPVIAGGAWALKDTPMGGPVKPAGEILGYPVYTNRWLPTLAQSAVSSAFAIFGNMRAMAFGDKGDMRVATFTSGNFGGKEIALGDQKGIVYKHRHGIVIVLPAAFVIAYTAAS